MNRVKISESEKQRILSKYVKDTPIDESIVITDWLSPDEKYMIFLDELYDIKNKKRLGDIWKDPSNLVLFLEHSYKRSNLKVEIKEHASRVLNNMLLTESNTDLTQLKPLIKQYLNEGKSIWQSFTSWLSNTAKETVTGVKDFFVDSWEGIKAAGIAISKGDWNEVLNLLKSGIKWFARKVRQALYSPAGLIVDAILVATGVGKTAQVVAWAIVVALDIYEFATGDFEHPDDPLWMRVAFCAIDILGLVTAGIAAKAARAAMAGIRTETELAQLLTRNPALREALVKVGVKLPELGSILEKQAVSLSGKFPKGSGFINSVLGGLGRFIKSIGETLGKIFSKAGLKAGAKTFLIVGGIGTAVEGYKSNVLEPKLEKEKENREKNEKQEEEQTLSLINKIKEKKLENPSGESGYDEFIK